MRASVPGILFSAAAAVLLVAALWFTPLASATVARADLRVPSVIPAATQPATDDEVRLVWLRDCAVCHGASGEGTPRGTNIQRAGRALTDYALSTGRMPIADPDQPLLRKPAAYRPELIAGLVDLVGGLGEGGPDIPVVRGTGDPARGGELYRAQCAACHAWSGKGGALLQRGAPSVLPATAVQVAEAVRTGPDTMPIFGQAAMTDPELEDVIAYIGALDRPRDVGGLGLWHLGPLVEGAVVWIAGVGVLLFLARRTGTRS